MDAEPRDAVAAECGDRIVAAVESAARFLPTQGPIGVFIAQNAIQAFEENAFDYLLKPVEPARLAKTLARLRQDITPQPVGTLAPTIHHIPGYLHNRVRLLPTSQVEYAFSDLGGVHVACQGELFHTQLTLKSLEEKTPLLRCHRQYLVAPAAIFEIRLLENQLAEIVTPSGARVPVSRRYLKELKDELGLE